MRQVHLTLVNPLGLHARAAAKFVDAAKAFGSDITIECGDKSANGKSIMDLHGGSIHIDSDLARGTCVTIRFPVERILAS